MWYILTVEELQKQFNPRVVERIMNLRLMDDSLMTKVFSDDIEATQFILRILLGNDKLTVLESHGQNELKNLYGRSVKLDILAEDSDHNLINVEIQRAEKGAEPKRARYHAAMLDTHFLEKNIDFNKLKNTYIIFITEKDFWRRKFPVYRINRFIEGTGLVFEDNLHILYVNGEYRGKDALGDLMHDFCCKRPEEMKFAELARKVKFYKQEAEGVRSMDRVLEEWGNLLVAERNVEIAESLIKENVFSFEKIAELSDLPFEEVLKLAEKIKSEVDVG